MRDLQKPEAGDQSQKEQGENATEDAGTPYAVPPVIMMSRSRRASKGGRVLPGRAKRQAHGRAYCSPSGGPYILL